MDQLLRLDQQAQELLQEPNYAVDDLEFQKLLDFGFVFVEEVFAAQDDWQVDLEKIEENHNIIK